MPNVSYTIDENKVYYNPYVEPIQPNDEIWYATTNESTIKPYTDNWIIGIDGKQAKIVSNTYESGKGIIKLEGDLYGLGSYTATFAPSFNSIFTAEPYCLTLSFPPSLTQITLPIIHEMPSVIGIYFNSNNPPKLSGYLYTSESDDSMYSNLIIYVPSASVDAYKSADGWSDYADKIQPIP